MITLLLIGLGVLLFLGVIYFLGVFDGSLRDADAGPTQFGDEDDHSNDEGTK